MNKKAENHINKKKDLMRKIGIFVIGVFILTSIIGSVVSVMPIRGQNSVTTNNVKTNAPTNPVETPK